MEGKNIIITEKQPSVMKVFLKQFCDLLVFILIAAAMISALSSGVENTVVILIVICVNAILGTVQEIKARKSLEGLKRLSSPKAKIIRNGRTVEIDSIDVQVGDRLLLEAGDMIVADGNIDKNYSLKVNESAITGESVSVEKTDKVYSGTYVTYGRAEIIVTKIGMDTEIGKIAIMLNNEKNRKTPLQISLDKFSKNLAIAIMGICVVVFLLYWLRGWQMIDSLMFAVALAVAAIPEALGSIITIVQAIGTSHMAKEKAIIRNLKAVETLGCVSIICSDKTGTLTQNKMTVKNIFVGGKSMKPQSININSNAHKQLLYCAVLNNDAEFCENGLRGDPTETALLDMSNQMDESIDLKTIKKDIKRIEELPFDSDRKMMSVKCIIDEKSMILTKGAFEVVIDRCKYIIGENGVRELNGQDIEILKENNEKYATNGERVLAFAYKDTDEILTAGSEMGLIFAGLISMMDPPRIQSRDAVRAAKSAGIKTIIITGDNKLTAKAIAKEVDIYHEGDIVLDGEEVEKLTEEGLMKILPKVSVYARVSPEVKIRIVKAWQKSGHITAMTGDGVNDAPALKRADIGVGMGTGTEVAKDASDMVIADDNFSTIIGAVSNGRNVYRNIKNAIIFLLSGNMAGIITVLFTSILALPSPFTAIQLLFINLVTDSFPALAIGMEKNDAGLLKQKPRNQEEGILTREFCVKILWQGALISMVTLLAYFTGLKTSPLLAGTYAFITLTIARLFHGFNCRNEGSILKIGILSNVYSVGAFFVGMILVLIIISVPYLNYIFNISSIGGAGAAIIIVLSFIPTFIIQILKCKKDRCGK